MQVLKGLATFVPGLYRLASRKWTGGTCSARYCYSVWLRHLVQAARHQLPTDPKVVAELGPGDSIGIGLAALLSGVEQYYALDAVAYADLTRNLAVFDELVRLFEGREPIPGSTEFPDVHPALDAYGFPHDILNPERLARCMDHQRLEEIRQSIRQPGTSGSRITYIAPWMDLDAVSPESLDMVFSQAVLEHVNDLGFTYTALFHWLRPGGIMSHRIDFKCHGTAAEWNGHWLYPDLVWRMIKGNRPFLINREPHSTHLRLLVENGFELACDLPNQRPSSYSLQDFAPHFRVMTEEDRTTSGAFMQAIKPINPRPCKAPPSR